MGKIIENGSAIKKVEERCKRLTFDAPKGAEQVCIQEYEHYTTVDDEEIKAETVRVDSVAVKDILDIIIVINGREISGQEVASWIYLINDNRAEIMEKRYFDPSK